MATEEITDPSACLDLPHVKATTVDPDLINAAGSSEAEDIVISKSLVSASSRNV